MPSIGNYEKKKYFKFLTNIIVNARLEEVIAFFPSGFGAVLGALLGVILGVWWAGLCLWVVILGVCTMLVLIEFCPV